MLRNSPWEITSKGVETYLAALHDLRTVGVYDLWLQPSQVQKYVATVLGSKPYAPVVSLIHGILWWAHLPTPRQGLMIQKMQRPIWIMQGFGRCRWIWGQHTKHNLAAACCICETLGAWILKHRHTDKATRAPFVTVHRLDT